MARSNAATVEEQPQTRTFDAPAHMRKIRTRQGMQDYLDVKWRVAWLRAEFPTAQIVTEQIEGDVDHARFKCTITLPNGAISSGHGSETAAGLPGLLREGGDEGDWPRLRRARLRHGRRDRLR